MTSLLRNKWDEKKCSHFVEFIWHQNSQEEEENSVHLRLQSSHCCWEASMSLRLHVACDSARHAWHTGCVSSLCDGICCHPVVWIVTLCCHTVMADWHDSQTSGQPSSLTSLSAMVSSPADHQRLERMDGQWESQGSVHHRTVELPPLLQQFSNSTVLQTELKNQCQILLLLSFPALLKSYITADRCIFWKIFGVANQILLGLVMYWCEYTFWIQIFLPSRRGAVQWNSIFIVFVHWFSHCRKSYLMPVKWLIFLISIIISLNKKRNYLKKIDSRK